MRRNITRINYEQYGVDNFLDWQKARDKDVYEKTKKYRKKNFAKIAVDQKRIREAANIPNEELS